MRVAVASDHARWPLRERAMREVAALGHEVVDCGQAGRADRGLLMCGSGVGGAIAASKLHRIRACTCHDCFSARQGVEDDDMNVLCLGARVVGEELAADLVREFLGAQFSGLERHARRVAKVRAMEASECGATLT